LCTHAEKIRTERNTKKKFREERKQNLTASDKDT
jgi:hypothetical protein